MKNKIKTTFIFFVISQLSLNCDNKKTIVISNDTTSIVQDTIEYNDEYFLNSYDEKFYPYTESIKVGIEHIRLLNRLTRLKNKITDIRELENDIYINGLSVEIAKQDFNIEFCKVYESDSCLLQTYQNTYTILHSVKNKIKKFEQEYDDSYK